MMPKFPTSDCLYDAQIWPLSFEPCPTHLFDPPCTDPSTQPHIQESDVHQELDVTSAEVRGYD